MRITKLHLLLIFLLLGAGGWGYYFWEEAAIRQKKEAEFRLQEEVNARKIAEEERLKKLAESSPPHPAPAPVEEKKEPTPVTYLVKKGDTLWKIAKMQEHFGLGHRWYDIWKANEDTLLDFDKIRSGQLITIPLDKPDGYEWPETSQDRKNQILGTPTPQTDVSVQ